MSIAAFAAICSLIAMITCIRGLAFGRNPYKSILLSSVYSSFMAMIYFMFLKLEGTPLSVKIASTADQAAELIAGDSTMVQALESQGLSSAEIIAEFKNLYISAFNSLPSTVLIWSALISYFVSMFILHVMNKKAPEGKIAVPKLPELKTLNLPKNSVFCFCFILLLAYVFSLSGFEGAKLLPANIETILTFAYAVQGASFMFFLCDMKRIPKPVCIIGTGLIFFVSAFQLILTMVGLIDLCFDLRMRMQIGKKR